jgi:hypothetical protein
LAGLFLPTTEFIRVLDVRQTEIHTAEPLVPEPSTFKFEWAINKLKIRKAPGIYQNPAELFKEGRRTIGFEIFKLVVSIWKKKELPEKWESIIVPKHKELDKTGCNNFRGI